MSDDTVDILRSSMLMRCECRGRESQIAFNVELLALFLMTRDSTSCTGPATSPPSDSERRSARTLSVDTV